MKQISYQNSNIYHRTRTTAFHAVAELKDPEAGRIQKIKKSEKWKIKPGKKILCNKK